jgi:hypothetical protein
MYTIKNKLKATVIALAMFTAFNAVAQEQKAVSAGEQYGKALNIGLGLGYGGPGSSPGIGINYEFDVAKNFTVAPFLFLRSYSNGFYTSTIIPIGAKGTYYFDELLGLNDDRWDVYLAASLGYTVISETYKSTYTGPSVSPEPLFLVGHIGGEYHFNKKIGLVLDLGSGLSTLGVAFHL